MFEDDNFEIKDAALEEERRKKEEEEKNRKKEEEIEYSEDNNPIINGIEIIEDSPKKSKKGIIITLLIILLLAGGIVYYLYYKGIIFKKEEIVIDNFEVVTSEEDIGNYFMDILNNNGFNYNGNNYYDITINYGQITDNLNLKIVFKSLKCTEDIDPNCNYFNTSKTIDLIINDKEYKYYEGYNNSYDVIEGILKHGYIALLDNDTDFYIVNNSDTIETYELDEVSKPNIVRYYINEKTKEVLNEDLFEYRIKTKYVDYEDNKIDCPIVYDKEEKALEFCDVRYTSTSKIKYYGKNNTNNKELEKLNVYSYDYYLELNKKSEDHEYGMPTISKTGKNVRELKSNEIENFITFINNYYNGNLSSLSCFNNTEEGLYQSSEVNSNNINDTFIKEYLLFIYKGNIVETISNEVYYKSYNYNELNNLYKNVFKSDNDLSKDDFNSCKYEETTNNFTCEYSFCSPSNEYDVFTQIIENYENEDDNLYIYIRTMYDHAEMEFIPYGDFHARYVYARPNLTKLIVRKNNILNFTNEEYNKLFEQGQLYKFTFTKNENNTYYWVSTKPI